MLTTTGLPPELLELEITETALVKDIRPGGSSLFLPGFTNINGTLFFFPNDVVVADGDGMQLFRKMVEVARAEG